MLGLRAAVGSLFSLLLLFSFSSHAQTTVSPTSVSFGSTALGTTSSTKNVTLKNTQTVPLNNIAASASQDYVITATTCTDSLAAGKNCTFSVAFAPTVLGADPSTLTITHSASNSPQTVALSGTGISPTTLTPASLSFPATTVGSSSSAQSVTLKNNQNVPLSGISISISADYLQTNNCPAILNPGASCKMNVTFHPLAGGTRNGLLTIADSAVNSPQSVALTGTGTGVTIGVTPLSLSFGTQLQGTVSVPQSITVTNTGSLSVSMGGISVSGEFAQSNNCPASLGVGASCAIAATFAPQSTGAKPGGVTISDNATGAPHVVTLSGTGASMTVTVAPSSIAFGNQLQNTSSAAQVVTVTNTGTLAVGISGVAVSGEFTQTNNCPASLAPAANCTVNLVFAPQSTGAKSGTLTISDNASGGPHSVALTGTGTSMRVSVAPGSLNFGNQLVGTTSATQAVTVTNTGTLAVSISGITASGEFTESDDCGTSLASSAACTVKVAFAPQTTGAKTGTLTINDNANGGPHTVALTANGTSMTLSVSPASIAFADEPTGATSSPPQTITVSNTGTLGVNITAISISGEFTQTNNCSATLAAGSSCAISATFSPHSIGAKSGTLTIDDNATGGPHTIALSGNGAAPVLSTISITPASARILLNATATFSATAVYTDGSTQDVTASSVWSSSDPSVVSVSNNEATAVTAGTVTLTAQYQGVSGTASVIAKGAGSVSAGNLNFARALHKAVTLLDGRVLVLGGIDANNQNIAQAELFDPSTAQFTVTGSMVYPRSRFNAVRLQDGRVLVVGGGTTVAEIYDPASATFALTGSTVYAHSDSAATVLQDGRVLVTGGVYDYSYSYLPVAEIYDPQSGTFTAAAPMIAARREHTSTLLQDGRVLIVGGDQTTQEGNAEIFDPSTGLFSATGSMPVQRFSHTATLLQDGRVLIAAGYGTDLLPVDAFIYDPAKASLSPAGSLHTSRVGTATLLPDGRVMIGGGFAWYYSTASIEIYDPATQTFNISKELNSRRGDTAANLLADGEVLFTGGTNDDGGISVAPGAGPVNTAELYSGSTTLTNVQVTPQQAVLSSSGWMQFRLVGTFADGSTQELSVLADWAAADPTILYMDGHSGDANGNGVAGTTTVTAQFAGLVASTTVTVTQ